MRTLVLLSALSYLCFQAHLQAFVDEQAMTGICSKSSSQRPKVQDSGLQETATGVWTAKNAPHRLTEIGFFISGDFLYWRADEDGLQYAQVFNGPRSSHLTTTSSTTTEILDLDFGWDPGFRAGVGWQMPNWDGWDCFLNGTYFRTEASGNTTIAPNLQPTQAVYDIWAPQWLSSPPAVGTEASARWKLLYSVLDLELGREFFVGSKLAMRPFLSARGAYIGQNYHSKYAGNLNSFPYTSKMDAKNNYWGAGLRGGSGLHWHFTKQFGLVGQLSLALLFGQFTVEQNTYGFNISSIAEFSPQPTIFNAFKVHYDRMRANLEGQLALRVEFPLYSNRQLLQFDLGYDFSFWFGQNQLNRFAAGTMYESSLGGGTTGGAVEYVRVTSNLLIPDCQNGNLGLQGLFLTRITNSKLRLSIHLDIYTARDSRIASGSVEQPLKSEPPVSPNFFKLGCFGAGFACPDFKALPCHIPILESLSV